MPGIQELIAELERNPVLPPGDDERFSGYGVMGVPFTSGHVLGLRRFTSTSVGPAFTSVWIMKPGGEWTIYSNIEPELSCPRYFGKALGAASMHSISIQWHDDMDFTVSIKDEEVDLDWGVHLGATVMTRLMSTVSNSLPEALWRNHLVLRMMGAVAGPSLRAGRIGLQGRAPNNHQFKASPKRMWLVKRSSALLNGEDLGTINPLPTQTRLGDFWIPQRGIFMIGGAAFDPTDSEVLLTRGGRELGPSLL